MKLSMPNKNLNVHFIKQLFESHREKRRGKYCVSGSRENVSCANTSYSPGISAHRFPSDKVLFPRAL